MCVTGCSARLCGDAAAVTERTGAAGRWAAGEGSGLRGEESGARQLGVGGPARPEAPARGKLGDALRRGAPTRRAWSGI